MLHHCAHLKNSDELDRFTNSEWKDQCYTILHSYAPTPHKNGHNYHFLSISHLRTVMYGIWLTWNKTYDVTWYIMIILQLQLSWNVSENELLLWEWPWKLTENAGTCWKGWQHKPQWRGESVETYKTLWKLQSYWCNYLFILINCHCIPHYYLIITSVFNSVTELY